MNHDDGQFLQRLATIFEMDVRELDLDTPLISLATWDSLSALEVVAMLDKEYGVVVSIDGLNAAESPRGILKLARP